MSTYYGSWVSDDDFRAVLDVSTGTGDGKTTYTITGTVKVETKYGWASGGVSGNLKVAGSSKKSVSGQSMSTWSTKTLVSATSTTITRTHNTQSISVQGVVAAANTPYYGASSTASTTVTVPAKASYTVSFNANGGSGAPSDLTKWHGETLTLSTTKPSRTGYTFQGWSASSTATSASYAAGGNYTANAAATLYAVWKANTYTVSYNANGGSNAPSAQTKTYGVTLALTTDKPSRTGYTFSGWNTKSDGTGTNYASGGNYTANAAVTLYAKWTVNTYAVKYDANGGTGAPAQQTKTYGVALTLSTATPSRATATNATYTISYSANGGSTPASSATSKKTTSYAFSKWNTAANGSGTSYNKGASYTANAAATLYAQWTSTTSTSAVTLPTPTRTDYTFNGWYTAATGGTRVGGAGSSYTPTASITLYAQWTLNYSAPTLTKLTAIRCESDGTASDTGTYVKATLTWTNGTAAPSSVVFKAMSGSTQVASQTVSVTSGTTATATFGGALSTEQRYTIVATLTDAKSKSYSRQTILTPSFYTMDFLAGGKGVAIGQAASKADTFEVALGTTALHGAVEADGYARVTRNGSGFIHQRTNITDGVAPSSQTSTSSFMVYDSAGSTVGWMDVTFLASGEQRLRLGARRSINGTVKYNLIQLGLDDEGNPTVKTYDAAGTKAWRDGLNVPQVSNQAAQVFNISAGNGSGQVQALSFNVTNTSNTTYHGKRMQLVLGNSLLNLYNGTDGQTVWQLSGLSGNLDLSTQTTNLTPTNATANTLQLRKFGNVVELVVYNLNVTTALASANNSNVAIVASGAVPSEYRPTKNLLVPVAAPNVTIGAGLFLYVMTGGNILLYNRSGASLPTSANVSANATWIV